MVPAVRKGLSRVANVIGYVVLGSSFWCWKVGQSQPQFMQRRAVYLTGSMWARLPDNASADHTVRTVTTMPTNTVGHSAAVCLPLAFAGVIPAWTVACTGLKASMLSPQ